MLLVDGKAVSRALLLNSFWSDAWAIKLNFSSHICYLTTEYLLQSCRELCFDRRLCLHGSPINNVVVKALKNSLIIVSNISIKGKLGTRWNVVRSELAWHFLIVHKLHIILFKPKYVKVRLVVRARVKNNHHVQQLWFLWKTCNLLRYDAMFIFIENQFDLSWF